MKGLAKHWFPIALAAMVIVITLIIWKPWGDNGIEFEDYGDAPNFTLENTEGKATSLSDEDGKVRLVYFFFSHCPDICIPTTSMLSKVQEKLKESGIFGTQAVMYSISFDPDRDTRERLKKFAEGYQADFGGWQFLRGEEAAIKELALKYKISVIKDQQGNFIHQNIFTLIDKEGRVRNYYKAGDPEVVASGVLIDQIAGDMLQLTR